jgi:glycosyltransferase involved in cell wall biosynthesis
LRSVLTVMQLRHEQHRWAFSVWRKEAIAPTDLAGAQLAPLRVTFLLPDTGAWGGIRQVYSLAEALAQRGHTVRLMARGERPANLDPKVEFHTVERYQPATAASVPPSDFIIGTWHNTVPVALAVAAAHPNALALHYSQGYESAFPEQARRRGAIERVYRLPTLKVTPCPKMVGELRLRFGQEPAYLPQFVASREFAPGRRAFAQDGYIWVLIVGPFETAWKGIETAVRGIALVQREMPAIRLRRVSQFPMPAAEKALHTPDEFHVGVDAARMAELMRDSDLFVSASLEDEGFGLPALEALRCGLPCVLSRISAYLTFDPERADYALFATPGDPNAFAQALRELIADEGRRQRFTRRGVEVAARYFDGSNTPVLWERYLQTLKQLAPQLAALQRGRTS